jgi:FkbM family methyltransferase
MVGWRNGAIGSMLRRARRAARFAVGLVHDARRVYRLRYRPIVDVRGIRLQMGPHTSKNVQAEILRANYEIDEHVILDSFLRPDDTVMELGTGLGYLSILCAKRVGSERVYTYEANAELERPVHRNYVLNGVSPHFEICILGARAGEQTLYVEHDMWGSSTLRRSVAARAVTVPMRSLNDELRRVRPTLLVVDIEGGEGDLIRFVELDGVERVLIELHPHIIGADRVAEVRAFFTSAGFDVAHARGNVVAFGRARTRAGR